MAQVNLVGKNILGYKVSEKLGSGAFGTVYKVEKRNVSGQYVRALKHIAIPTEKQYYSVLNSMGGNVVKTDNYFLEMLETIVSEIKILNTLSEKGVQNIVRYYENDIVESDSPKRYDIYILMEYLTPLEDYIQRTDFSVRDVVMLGFDVLSGLRACHINGVIHRDIKDDNIFVNNEGNYKIGDFGVSKILKEGSKAESLKGTPNFLAPEVYLGKGSYTKSVDLYSLGILMYRLLNYNRNPFLPHFPEQYFSRDEDVAFEKRMMGEAPDLPSLGGEQIGMVIVKAISNKSERFQTAEEFQTALEIAVNNTTEEILNRKIKISDAVYTSKVDFYQKNYQETIGEVATGFYEEELEEVSFTNKYLFETMGEFPVDEKVKKEEIYKSESNAYEEKSKNKLPKTEEVKRKRFSQLLEKTFDEKDTLNIEQKKSLETEVVLEEQNEKNNDNATKTKEKPFDLDQEEMIPRLLGSINLYSQNLVKENSKLKDKAKEEKILIHLDRGELISRLLGSMTLYSRNMEREEHKEENIEISKAEDIKKNIGRDVIQEDSIFYKSYMSYWRSAEEGDTEAQVKIGDYFHFGFGVKEDDKKAIEWYKKAAEQGSEEGRLKLGNMYRSGWGTEKDYKEAVKWYAKAAMQGNAESQYELGYCYRYGRGIKRNYEKAVKWYEKAVENGNKDAASELAECYAKGYGVKKDKMRALSLRLFKK